MVIFLVYALLNAKKTHDLKLKKREKKRLFCLYKQLLNNLLLLFRKIENYII